MEFRLHVQDNFQSGHHELFLMLLNLNQVVVDVFMKGVVEIYHKIDNLLDVVRGRICRHLLIGAPNR
jgi:hypothetical protein